MQSRLKQARFPWIKMLEQFDFSFQPDIERKVVRALVELTFVGRCKDVILLEPSGNGKTHLAVALGVKVADAAFRVLFMPMDRQVSYKMIVAHDAFSSISTALPMHHCLRKTNPLKSLLS